MSVTVIEGNIAIDVPIERVYEYISDFATYPQWIRGAGDAERTEVNRKWSAQAIWESPQEYKITVTNARAPQTLAWCAVGDGLQFDCETALREATRNSTEVHMTRTFSDIAGADDAPTEASIARLGSSAKRAAEGDHYVDAIFKRAETGFAQRDLDEDLRRLKQFVEDAAATRAIATMEPSGATIEQSGAATESDETAERQPAVGRDAPIVPAITPPVVSLPAIVAEMPTAQMPTAQMPTARRDIADFADDPDATREVRIVRGTILAPATLTSNAALAASPPLPNRDIGDYEDATLVPVAGHGQRAVHAPQKMVAPNINRLHINVQPEEVARKTTLFSTRVWVLLLAIFALTAGVVWWTANFNNSRQQTVPPIDARQSSETAPEALPQTATAPTTQTSSPSAPASGVAPATPSNVTTRSGAGDTGDAEATLSSGVTTGNNRAVLLSNLNDWTQATNDRNINRQVSFYAPLLERYYRQRNVTRETVRLDKIRAAQTTRDIATSDPEFASDGRVVTMRFRKDYTAVGGSVRRRGTVLQELKWESMQGGWKIISERDVRVVR